MHKRNMKMKYKFKILKDDNLLKKYDAIAEIPQPQNYCINIYFFCQEYISHVSIKLDINNSKGNHTPNIRLGKTFLNMEKSISDQIKNQQHMFNTIKPNTAKTILLKNSNIKTIKNLIIQIYGV